MGAPMRRITTILQAPAPMQRIIDCPVAEFTSLFFDEPPEKPVPPNAPKRAPPA